MMTLRQIRHFIAVAETGSISAAAQTAFISQSTLTLAIQQLEQEIGVNLFNRHAKGMTLTHQGHQFLRQAHLILATVDNAKRSLQQSTDQVAGQLIIGVTSLVAGYRPCQLLLALTPRPETARRLALVCGAVPIVTPPAETAEKMERDALRAARDTGLVGVGEAVVLTAGLPLHVPGRTNLIKVAVVA